MDKESKFILSEATCEYLAQVWLQQQDLSGKSPIEIADMYCSALSVIREKYSPPQQQPQRGPRVINRGI